MELNLSGKKALVTASGRGIGRAMVRTLAAEGAHVAFVARSQDDIDALSRELSGVASPHLGIALDLLPEGAPRDLVTRIRESGFGDVEIVVHNLGGTLDISDPLCSVNDWRKVWRLNLEVAIELNLHFLPTMQRRGWGRIVHVSSISSMENHGPISYCATKAALNAYTRGLGRAMAPSGVIVSAILPGAIWTEDGYWDRASKERPEHLSQYLRERMAIGRLGRPEEIAGVVALLCSDHASFCVGSLVPVDGGQGRSYFGY